MDRTSKRFLKKRFFSRHYFSRFNRILSR
ncbi:hypothetical protein BAE44_0017639 [Dichanthelium oligosanthes]|uniref:Uncharacterized protein n=1 Tax=Dichanthelium oligosanthes TaxID=888268 RepID=A0A1E5V857_9POAL|nr:hypothetical protein BAE44_0017639 [Dichanthelium oligosanthes]